MYHNHTGRFCFCVLQCHLESNTMLPAALSSSIQLKIPLVIRTFHTFIWFSFRVLWKVPSEFGWGLHWISLGKLVISILVWRSLSLLLICFFNYCEWTASMISVSGCLSSYLGRLWYVDFCILVLLLKVFMSSKSFIVESLEPLHTGPNYLQIIYKLSTNMSDLTSSFAVFIPFLGTIHLSSRKQGSLIPAHGSYISTIWNTVLLWLRDSPL